MKKLTLRNYIGYASGDLANNLAFSLQALFLLIYYTNVVGLDAAVIATMFLVVRVWDAFADLVA
jgi:glucuronide carrier protein